MGHDPACGWGVWSLGLTDFACPARKQKTERRFVAAVLFPPVGYTQEEGVVVAWLKQPGQTVQQGEDLLELALEKTIHVVTAPQAGIVSAIYAPAGAVVAQGEMLAWIGQAGEAAPSHTVRLLGWDAEVSPPPSDLLQQLAAAQPAASRSVESNRSQRALLKTRLRHTTGQRMTKSWQAPKVDLFTDVDFSAVIALREAAKQAGTEAPSYNAYMAHAAAQAFAQFPHLNGHWLDTGFSPLAGVHMGFAVALPDGLITVSLKDVQSQTPETIHSRFKGLLRKALSMSLTHADMFANSLTLTNLGDTGVSGFTALLNPPEIFILAVGQLEDRAVVRQGQIVVRPMATLCLSFDHRAVDGQPAALFLKALKQHLETP